MLGHAASASSCEEALQSGAAPKRPAAPLWRTADCVSAYSSWYPASSKADAHLRLNVPVNKGQQAALALAWRNAWWCKAPHSCSHSATQFQQVNMAYRIVSAVRLRCHMPGGEKRCLQGREGICFEAQGYKPRMLQITIINSAAVVVNVLGLRVADFLLDRKACACAAQQAPVPKPGPAPAPQGSGHASTAARVRRSRKKPFAVTQYP